jgi:spore coat polysaccharide biosynthesis protein SpsF (cytidylyltransferase family)
MRITIDTEKDLDKIVEIIISLSEEKRDKVFDKIREYRNNRFYETQKEISDVLKKHHITKEDMLKELKQMREK